MTLPAKKLHHAWMQDPAYLESYEGFAPEFQVALELIAARARAGLSQAEVAHRMGTTQSAVARLESGRQKPSTRSLERYAQATGSTVKIALVPAKGTGA
jgi:DNA-binding XRE family transcriptional regulator